MNGSVHTLFPHHLIITFQQFCYFRYSGPCVCLVYSYITITINSHILTLCVRWLMMLGCSRTDFKLQLEHFDKESFTLVAWDPRGYGKSIPPSRDWPDQFFRRDANDAVKLMEV